MHTCGSPTIPPQHTVAIPPHDAGPPDFRWCIVVAVQPAVFVVRADPARAVVLGICTPKVGAAPVMCVDIIRVRRRNRRDSCRVFLAGLPVGEQGGIVVGDHTCHDFAHFRERGGMITTIRPQDRERRFCVQAVRSQPHYNLRHLMAAWNKAAEGVSMLRRDEPDVVTYSAAIAMATQGVGHTAASRHHAVYATSHSISGCVSGRSACSSQ